MNGETLDRENNEMTMEELLAENALLRAELRKIRASEGKALRSLDEKNVLLRELHHRVKNNLQVVSSLLDLRAMSAHDHYSVQALQDARQKIHAIAVIHSLLYNAEKLDSISMSAIAKELISAVKQIHSPHDGMDVEFAIDGDVVLPVTQALPCTLIVNELALNAMRHAFPPGWKGKPKIEIAAEENETGVRLTVKDNGIGLPKRFDLLNAPTLGFKLVADLAQRQLRGTINVENQGGAAVCVTFGRPADG